jgi:hypothetical protein
MSKDIFIYRIDINDTIVSVSDNGYTFADANRLVWFLASGRSRSGVILPVNEDISNSSLRYRMDISN